MGQASNHRATIANMRGDDAACRPHYGNTNFDSDVTQNGQTTAEVAIEGVALRES
jgi:hypothetical protein